MRDTFKITVTIALPAPLSGREGVGRRIGLLRIVQHNTMTDICVCQN